MKFIPLLLSLVLVACNSRTSTLSFNLVSEDIQFDWSKANDGTSAVVLDNIMEGLTSYAGALQANQQGDLLRPVPALASSWTIENDGKLYRFRIREGVRWSDGEPLKAQHFVDSWERLLSPETKSGSAYHLFDIVGAQDFASGRIKDFSQVGVHAVDERTLEVQLRRPASYFLHLLATPGTFPLRRDLVEKLGPNWASPQNLVTLGPYTLKEWNHGDRLVLEANKNYWEGVPAIRTVICKMVTEPLTALSLYVNGDLDILPRELPVSYYEYWVSHDDYRTGAKLSVSYLAFNVRKPPFNKVSERRAFARAVNRDELVKVFQGSQTPTTSLIPPGMFGHMPSLGISFDPQARLKSSGTLRLKYNASDNLNLVFQSLQQALRQKSQTSLRLEPSDWKEYKEFLNGVAGAHPALSLAEQPNVLYINWGADYPDPHSFMSVFTSASENNYTGWTNRRYDALVEQAVETEDESRRMSLYEQAQRILLEDEVVVLPLFFSSHQALVKANIKGVVLNSLDKWYFKNFHFEP